MRGLALVGSHARGTARADSDLALVLLTADPALYLAGTGWARKLDPEGLLAALAGYAASE